MSDFDLDLFEIRKTIELEQLTYLDILTGLSSQIEEKPPTETGLRCPAPEAYNSFYESSLQSFLSSLLLSSAVEQATQREGLNRRGRGVF
ncbi:hypothetical protein ACOSQ2_003182 [Xanthoceras sorbifolium]